MKNMMITKIEKANINNFTSNFGLKARQIFHKPISLLFRFFLKFIYKKNVIIDKKVNLDKNKCYIFAANHSFFYDGAAVIATVDKNCYSLFGATEQLYFDIRTIFIWLSGLIYINRFDKQSRKDSIEKMNRVLQAGNSILIFPEGRWNDSENLLCQKLFAGPYNLSLHNKVEVIPVSLYNETYGKNIYISYGVPLKLYNYDKDKALQLLRDNLATMFYEQIINHSIPYTRPKTTEDIHLKYMEERMFEYSEANWRSDYCWDEELFIYKAGDIDIEDVWKDIDKVKIDKNNLDKFYELLKELKRKEIYNFKNYMNENYRKKY